VSTPTGRRAIGTLNNCAGGITPWGTYLMAEKNFHLCSSGGLEGHPERASHERIDAGGRARLRLQPIRERIAAARAANRDLLDQGTLRAARLGADGVLQWLALAHGQGS
jgi:secreted PhoX family phosphatase